jgi:hypothetical protein
MLDTLLNIFGVQGLKLFVLNEHSQLETSPALRQMLKTDLILKTYLKKSQGDVLLPQ